MSSHIQTRNSTEPRFFFSFSTFVYHPQNPHFIQGTIDNNALSLCSIFLRKERHQKDIFIIHSCLGREVVDSMQWKSRDFWVDLSLQVQTCLWKSCVEFTFSINCITASLAALKSFKCLQFTFVECLLHTCHSNKYLPCIITFHPQNRPLGEIIQLIPLFI